MAKTKSIIVDCMDNCFVCASPYVEVHHVIYGRGRRKISDAYGLVIPLCPEHHRGQTGVHFNPDFDMAMKQLAQRKFEERFGNREAFRMAFGKSYL